MRIVLAILFLAAALWRAGIDWQATIGHGYAYRLTTIGGTLSETWPDAYVRAVNSVQASGIPYLWNPVGAFLMSLPVALSLLAVAVLLWIIRGSAVQRRS